MRLGEPVRLKVEVAPYDTKHCRSGAGSAIFFQAPAIQSFAASYIAVLGRTLPGDAPQDQRCSTKA
jgi:hypothetical protein